MYSFSSSICSLASLQALYIFPWDQQSLGKIFKALRMAKLHIDEQNNTYFYVFMQTTMKATWIGPVVGMLNVM